jgi:hypothetical protein
MKMPLWVDQAAAEFWEAAGAPEPFPRSLRDPLRYSSLDLSVKDVAGLSLLGAERYLTGCGFAWSCAGRDRPLRACLAAARGAGLVLLDADDPPREQAFSLAHEIGHFLRHYLEPRRRACRVLGPDAQRVLDGDRPPTVAERCHALLRGLRVGPHVHLMERGPGGTPANAAVLAAEEEADRLAYELLAPVREVWARGGVTHARAAEVLLGVFGLPPAQTDDCARLLFPPAPDAFLLRRLGGDK